MNKIIAFALRITGFGWIAEKVDGYKTRIGAVSLMLSGLAELTQKITSLTDLASIVAFAKALPLSPGWVALSAGIAAWGLARKAEKAAEDAAAKPELSKP